jgi:S-adenosylmethionine/arginine decarboxylase-like enzyme
MDKIIKHKHLIIRAECLYEPKSKESLKEWFIQLIKKIDMKLLSGPHVEYVDKEGNKGYTGVCIIETSHIALHTWNEVSPNLIQLDVYS